MVDRTETIDSHEPAATEQALKLWVVLSRAAQAIETHAVEDAQMSGLTLTEFGILEVLYHKGPLLLGEVQRRILVSSGGITYLVDRLVEKGFIERRECASDRRARYACLTKAGENLMKEGFPRHAARLTRAMAGLTEQEKKEATVLLRKLGLSASGATSG